MKADLALVVLWFLLSAFLGVVAVTVALEVVDVLARQTVF
jgi:hypothetical protein